MAALLLVGCASAAEPASRVGAATSNITPPLGEGIAGATWIHAATMIPMERMMMSATHTHSATSAPGSSSMLMRPAEPPPPLDTYETFLASRITDGVFRAVNNLAPVHIGWGAGQVPQHVFNRRWRL